MRSLKSLLGSKLIKHDTSVLGTAMPFKDLLGLFIGQLKSRAEAAAGREFEEVVLGRPVFFVDDDQMADQEAENTLVDVARKPSASRKCRSSTSRLPPRSTMSRPSKRKSWY